MIDNICHKLELENFNISNIHSCSPIDRSVLNYGGCLHDRTLNMSRLGILRSHALFGEESIEADYNAWDDDHFLQVM